MQRDISEYFSQSFDEVVGIENKLQQIFLVSDIFLSFMIYFLITSGPLHFCYGHFHLKFGIIHYVLDMACSVA